MAALSTYGEMPDVLGVRAMVGFLKRAVPLLTIEKFGQQYQIPKNQTSIAKFRRYYLANASGSDGNTGAAVGSGILNDSLLALTPVVEGVTPDGKKIKSKDYTVPLLQYGDFVTFTDVLIDFSEYMPQALTEFTDILGEQAALTVEKLRKNVLLAGTNVYRGNAVSTRDAVVTTVTRTEQRKITKQLDRFLAKPITKVLQSTTDYGTVAVEPAYIALGHTDLSADIRSMDGFEPASKYASMKPYEGELGKVENVRYILSTVFDPFLDAGGAKGSMTSTGGTKADVYPIIILGENAFGTVPLKMNTKSATTSNPSGLNVSVVNPTMSSNDPLAQRGVAAWKLYNAAIILSEISLMRWEVTATA